MRQILRQIAWMFLFMVIGTSIDFLVHSSRPAFYVEPSYYAGKMIFGIVWGVVGYYILKNILKVSDWKAMALGVPAIIAGALQTKYFYQGRDNFFVFLFLFLHFLMFLPASFYIFKKKQRVFPLADRRAAKQSGSKRWLYFIILIIIIEVIFYIYFHTILGYRRF